jgi:DhnA family fructose-bisphosphate aldolase class Ia
LHNSIRFARLFDQPSKTSTMIALSNSMYFGPSRGLETVASLRRAITASARGGADAIMITPGALRANVDLFATRDRPAIVLSAGYTNTWRAREAFGHEGRASDQALFASVEEAVRLHADAFHMYAFLGYSDATHEAREVARVGSVLEVAHSWGLPVICEPLMRGDQVPAGESNKPEHVALAARILSEVGADVVKCEYTGSPETYSAVVASSHAPVFMMGGDPMPTFDAFVDSVATAVSSGARGLAVGRNVYAQPDVEAAVRRVCETVRTHAITVQQER